MFGQSRQKKANSGKRMFSDLILRHKRHASSSSSSSSANTTYVDDIPPLLEEPSSSQFWPRCQWDEIEEEFVVLGSEVRSPN